MENCSSIWEDSFLPGVSNSVLLILKSLAQCRKKSIDVFGAHRKTVAGLTHIRVIYHWLQQQPEHDNARVQHFGLYSVNLILIQSNSVANVQQNTTKPLIVFVIMFLLKIMSHNIFIKIIICEQFQLSVTFYRVLWFYQRQEVFFN